MLMDCSEAHLQPGMVLASFAINYQVDFVTGHCPAPGHVWTVYKELQKTAKL